MPLLEDFVLHFLLYFFFLQARHPAYPRTRQTGQLHWKRAPPRRTLKSPRDDSPQAAAYWPQILQSPPHMTYMYPPPHMTHSKVLYIEILKSPQYSDFVYFFFLIYFFINSPKSLI